MRFSSPLFLGETALKKKNKVIKSIKTGKYMSGVYVICPAVCRSDLLDLMPAYMLHAERYRDALILGIAVSKQEAMEVGGMIISEVYEKTGGFDVRSYFAVNS